MVTTNLSFWNNSGKLLNPGQRTSISRHPDARWDEDHLDIASAVAAEISCYYGPMSVIKDAIGYAVRPALSDRRQLMRLFVAGIEHSGIEAFSTIAPKASVAPEAIQKTPDRYAEGNQRFLDLFYPNTKPLPDNYDEVKAFLAAVEPTMDDAELEALEQQALDAEKGNNLPQRMQLAKRELKALADYAKSFPEFDKRGRKSARRSLAWIKFFRRRDHFHQEGLLAELPSDKQITAYQKRYRAFCFATQRQAMKFGRIASKRPGHRSEYTGLGRGEAIRVLLSKQGFYLAFVGETGYGKWTADKRALARKADLNDDPVNQIVKMEQMLQAAEVGRWFNGVYTQSPYRKGGYNQYEGFFQLPRKEVTPALIKRLGLNEHNEVLLPNKVRNRRPKLSASKNCDPLSPRVAELRPGSKIKFTFDWIEADNAYITITHTPGVGGWQELRADNEGRAMTLLQAFIGDENADHLTVMCVGSSFEQLEADEDPGTYDEDDPCGERAGSRQDAIEHRADFSDFDFVSVSVDQAVYYSGSYFADVDE